MIAKVFGVDIELSNHPIDVVWHDGYTEGDLDIKLTYEPKDDLNRALLNDVLPAICPGFLWLTPIIPTIVVYIIYKKHQRPVAKHMHAVYSQNGKPLVSWGMPLATQSLAFGAEEFTVRHFQKNDNPPKPYLFSIYNSERV